MADKALNKTAAQINFLLGVINPVTGRDDSPNIVLGFTTNLIKNDANQKGNTISGGGGVGKQNKIDGDETIFATIGGGYENHIDGVNSTSSLDGAAATISGGAHHTIKTSHATIGGGSINLIEVGADYSTIGGGTLGSILATASFSTIAGGRNNVINNTFGTISGGKEQEVNGDYGTVLGGLSCVAGEYAVCGGENNTASGRASFVVGKDNIGAGYGSTVFGRNNYCEGSNSFALGSGNTCSSSYAGVWGYTNIVSGNYSTAFGREITVSGNYSVGIGLDNMNGATIANNNTLAILGGKVGIDVLAPSAKMHLPAGTATAGTAPLKLTTGVNLTTPEAGAVEWDGTNLFVTQADGTRKTIAYTA